MTQQTVIATFDDLADWPIVTLGFLYSALWMKNYDE